MNIYIPEVIISTVQHLANLSVGLLAFFGTQQLVGVCLGFRMTLKEKQP